MLTFTPNGWCCVDVIVILTNNTNFILVFVWLAVLVRCGPCMMMKPVLEEIAGRMEAEIKVAKVDTDKSPRSVYFFVAYFQHFCLCLVMNRLGSRYQIEALPTLILFSKGEIVERYVGYMNADQLEAAVKKVLMMR